MDVDGSTLVALGLLVAATLLTTGLLSVRIHAERSGALDRLERRQERLERLSAQGATVTDDELRAPREALATFDAGLSRLIAAANVAVLGVVVLVVGNWMRQAGWRYVWLDGPPPGYWALVVIVLLEALLVGIGIIDVARVARDVRHQGERTLTHRLEEIERHLGERRVDVARQEARRLHDQLPTATWPLRLLGFSHLAHDDWKEAADCFDRVQELRESVVPEPGRDLATVLGQAEALEGLGHMGETVDLCVEALAATGQEATDRVPAFASGPRRLETWVTVVEGLIAQGNPGAASRAVELLVLRHQASGSTYPEGREMMAAVMRSFREQGQVGEARETLRRWTTRAPWLAQTAFALRRDLLRPSEVA